MYCKHCGSFVGDTDMVCKNCGGLTDYGEKVSRHEAMPPQASPTGGNGVSGGVNLNDQFNSNPQGGSQPPYSASQNTNNAYGQGGYYYSPQNVSYPPRQEATGSNGMAVAGFVCAFLVPLLGFIFSIIGLNKSKNLGGTGRGLSIAGIIISVVIWVFNIVLFQRLLEIMNNYAMIGFLAEFTELFKAI